MIIPISNASGPFGDVDQPSETNMLMALATMHKMGRIPGTYSSIAPPTARKKKDDDNG